VRCFRLYLLTMVLVGERNDDSEFAHLCAGPVDAIRIYTIPQKRQS
jgi:hypothetical protein